MYRYYFSGRQLDLAQELNYSNKNNPDDTPIDTLEVKTDKGWVMFTDCRSENSANDTTSNFDDFVLVHECEEEAEIRVKN